MLVAMEGLSSQGNVLKLCDYIIGVIESKDQSKEDLTGYIKGLKYICYGHPEEGSLSLLTPQEKLSSILSINNYNAIFKMQHEDCIKTAETLLSYSHLTLELCKALKVLVTSILKMGHDKKLLIINKLFSHKDFPLVPVDLIEEIIRLDATQLELHIVGLYSELCNNDPGEIQLWKSDKNKHWISWCSKSPTLFNILTSIMLQILLIVKNQKAILKIIQNFITNLFQVCQRERLDFVSLYPIKLQSLVNLMSLEIDQLPVQYVHKLRNSIFEQINILKNENVFDALVLLTHFNKWENFPS